jgi:hypothetical protein
VVILLVQVHAIWEHLLQVAYLEGVVGSQVLAVHFKSGRVLIQEGPHIDLSYVEVEDATSLEMQTLILLYWVNGHAQQVRTTYYVPLQGHELGMSSLEVLIY